MSLLKESRLISSVQTPVCRFYITASERALKGEAAAAEATAMAAWEAMLAELVASSMP